jgi:hypothetical protein
MTNSFPDFQRENQNPKFKKILQIAEIKHGMAHNNFVIKFYSDG